LQQGCARALLGLLDLRGGSPCRALRGITLMRDRGGLARHEDLLRESSNRSGQRRPRPSDITLHRIDPRSSGCGYDCFNRLGQGCVRALSSW
jgi:hypothetical protein